MPSILNKHNIFLDMLNKGMYGILLIPTRNAYLDTPVYLYALYIPIFIRILPAYKNLYFLYSVMFDAVITWSYFVMPKNIRLNSRHYFIMKIPSKRELQQIPFNHIHHILALRTLWIFLKNVLQNHIRF